MALGGIRPMWRLASASTGGASRWKVCYQRGRPRLVLVCIEEKIALLLLAN